VIESEVPQEFAGGIEIDDRPREACGVFGVFDAHGVIGNVAVSSLDAARRQQPRGQDACGISTVVDGEIQIYGQPGKVNKLDRSKVETMGVGAHISSSHVRYGTAKSTKPEAFIQPLPIGNGGETLGTIVHNGHVQPEVLAQAGSEYIPNTTDTERVANLLSEATERHGSIELAAMEVLPKIAESAFSFVITTPDKVMAVRDPYGFRPLVMGTREGITGEAYAFASQTSALQAAGFGYKRDVEPGEMIVVDEIGDRSAFPFGHNKDSRRRRLCSIEMIYFTDKSSIIDGVPVHMYQDALGKALARQDLEKYGDNSFADAVFGIPDSGLSAAFAYARELGLPIVHGLSKKDALGRTFIENGQANRERAVGQKLEALPGDLYGLRLVGVDDSFIRGTTGASVTRLARVAGASELHLRSTAPLYIASCHQGVDTGDESELLAVQCNGDIELMRQAVSKKAGTHLTSLDFLDVKVVSRILDVGYAASDARLGNVASGMGKAATGICTSCFTGEYPINIYKNGKLVISKSA
jgi:amidophosphoribosyltransferase